ncbi:MAG: EAL domain-containing protein, partial [Rhizobiales bacterium]|nr:EAL domain-containing protein [Hyphomicrobiales bacterium]
FDRIKVDGSFIQLTGSNQRADAIFKAVVGLGAALSVPVLAEGVETDAQLDFAKASGCEEIQGFNFGRPISETLLSRIHEEFDGAPTLQRFKAWQHRNMVHDLTAPRQDDAPLKLSSL